MDHGPQIGGLMVPDAVVPTALAPIGMASGAGFQDFRGRNLYLTGFAQVVGTITTDSTSITINADRVPPGVDTAVIFGRNAGDGNDAVLFWDETNDAFILGTSTADTVATTTPTTLYVGEVRVGFGQISFGQTAYGVVDMGLHRGLSGGIECNNGTFGVYTDFMAARFGTFQLSADVLPTSVLYKSQDSWTDATGGNQVGGTTRVYAGIGLWTLTVANFAGLVGQTVTITINGAANVLTEGVNFTAAVSNDATASSLRGAINAIAGTFSSVTANVIGLVGSIGGTYTITPTSSAAGGDLVIAQAANGSVVIGTNASTLTLASASLTTTVALLFSADNTLDIGATNATRPRTGYFGTSVIVQSGANSTLYLSAANAQLATGGLFGWTASATDATGALDTGLARLAAASVRQGLAPSATPVAQTFTLGEASRPGTDNNVSGSDGTIASGLGTGTGPASSLIFQTPTLAGAGSGAQAYATRFTIATASITSTVPLLFSADNTLDIGATNATRPRSIYLGTSLLVQSGANTLASFTSATGAFASGYTLTWSNSATSIAVADVGIARNNVGILEVNNGTPGGAATLSVNDYIAVGDTLTPGTMTAASPKLRSVFTQFAWTNAMVTALGGGTAGDITICTLPARTIVRNVYIVISTAAGTLASLTGAVGRTGATYIDYIVASSLKAAANTIYGAVAGDRGTNLTGYDLPSWTANTAIKMHFIGSAALNTVTTCTGLVLIETEFVG